MAKNKFAPEDVLAELKESIAVTPPTPTPDPSTLGPSPTPIIGETYSGSLDDAATLLLNILTPSIRDYVIELAEITLKIPRWQMLLGALLAQYESGTLAAPSVDPSWRQIEAVAGKNFCPECKKEFSPKRHKQVFCSTACGDQARGRAIREQNRQRDENQRRVKELEAEAGRVRML